MGRALLVSAALLLAMFLSTLFLYQQLPDTVAIHWNASGAADGFSGKGFGLFLLPAITGLCLLLFAAIPKIDPLKQNIQKFSTEYHGFVLVFSALFFALQIFVLAFNLGIRADIRIVIAPGIALLIAYTGYMMSKAKRNYFIGIRTPWTLASDKVWDKTHAIGSKLFYVLAAFVLLAAAFPQFFLWLLLVPIIAVTAFLFVYSYNEFRKEENK